MTHRRRFRLAALVTLLLGVPAAHAVVVTRGPYLQSPTPSSIIVRWRTDVATDSRVSYGASVGSLTTNADDPAPTTEHVVALSGLPADTQYYYAVGSAGGALVGDDADHYLRTSPVTGPARPMRIWVTGDGGFANANGQAVRDAYAAYNGSNPTDLWLLLGDNAYLLATDADYQAALFDMHHDLLRHTPVWSTFGNHEDFSADDITQTGVYFDIFSFPTAGQAGGVASGTEAYYSFDYANVHFVVLDSEAPAAHPGTPLPTDPMMVWLTADLQATSADWVIALWHRSAYSKGLLHDSDVELNEINMRQNVLPTLEAYGVDLVLTGHSHSYERSYLLDGHYGLSGTLTAANIFDSGTGDPAGDGAYRKESVGPAPHEGEVHAVCGSSSEVRNATLNHPAHKIGLLELGSMVIDISGTTLDARFLNSAVQVHDRFQIVKGPVCPPTPKTGCTAGTKGRLTIKDNPLDTKDKVAWTWRGGAITASQVGNPTSQADLAACFYDANGKLMGGGYPKSALWKIHPGGEPQYRDKLAAHHGFLSTRIRYTRPKISFTGRGSALGLPGLPLTGPVTAQMLQLDDGSCWENVFTTARKNDATQYTAVK